MTATFCLLRGLLVGAAGVEGVDGAAAGAARASAAAVTAGRDERTGGIARWRTSRRCSERDRGAAEEAIEVAGLVSTPYHGVMGGWGGGRAPSSLNGMVFQLGQLRGSTAYRCTKKATIGVG